ncbi:hypothetical protein [Marivirga sp.]|uniref:hypothetical protein n=1 Tax=Marivirga sp. TaxID=2018662 RepID=UPI002D8072AB|nr:hypothetical protein [Marivirga sp.]HET8860969.1 hypothetical protein [Marivirga sp.]
MNKILTLLLIAVGFQANAQENKLKATVEKIVIEYKGKKVKAKKLTVSSAIPMNIDSAWNNVKTPALLAFVAKGMIRFKPTGVGFPKQWELGETYGAKMRVFGFIPFGGTHYLFIEKIDNENYEIATREWDKSTKVWNHNILMKDLGNGSIYYEDSITIYGGMMTGFITTFAKWFYKHRQKRWQKVAEKNLKCG